MRCRWPKTRARRARPVGWLVERPLAGLLQEIPTAGKSSCRHAAVEKTPLRVRDARGDRGPARALRDFAPDRTDRARRASGIGAAGAFFGRPPSSDFAYEERSERVRRFSPRPGHAGCRRADIVDRNLALLDRQASRSPRAPDAGYLRSSRARPPTIFSPRCRARSSSSPGCGPPQKKRGARNNTRGWPRGGSGESADFPPSSPGGRATSRASNGFALSPPRRSSGPGSTSEASPASRRRARSSSPETPGLFISPMRSACARSRCSVRRTRSATDRTGIGEASSLR